MACGPLWRENLFLRAKLFDVPAAWTHACLQLDSKAKLRSPMKLVPEFLLLAIRAWDSSEVVRVCPVHLISAKSGVSNTAEAASSKRIPDDVSNQAALFILNSIKHRAPSFLQASDPWLTLNYGLEIALIRLLLSKSFKSPIYWKRLTSINVSIWSAIQVRIKSQQLMRRGVSL